MTDPMTYSDVLSAEASGWVRAGPLGAGSRSKCRGGQMQPDQICVLHEIEDDRLRGGEKLGHEETWQ